MVHKRPFPDEDSLEFPCKHPKQWECTNHLAPIMDINPFNDVHQKPTASDNDEEETFSKCQDQQGSEFQLVTEVSNGTDKDFQIGASGCISRYFWNNESAAETEADLEAAFHVSFFPEYFAPGHQLKSLLQSDEIYSSPIDCPPLKPVSIGPEHQAHIPEWGLKGSKNPSDTLDRSFHQVGFSHLSDSAAAVDEEEEEKLMGTCVLSMPDSEAFASSCSERWATRYECKCHDRGSRRCVRHHVREAREKVRENLGQKLFEVLGFCNMGEEVSEEWTEEEEQAFHGIVFSNPASMGKNFWDRLSLVFPSRTKKDLVSYYFNVFMLRKRADQNRFDPLDIDSDNDEWQVSEQECRVIEEDEDSGVESLTNQDVPPYYQEDHAEDSQDDIEGEHGIDNCKDGASVVCTVATDEEDEGGVDELSVPHVRNCIYESGGNNDLQLFSKIQICLREDDIQDDSCTSYEYEQANYHAPLSTGTDGKPSCQD